MSHNVSGIGPDIIIEVSKEELQKVKEIAQQIQLKKDTDILVRATSALIQIKSFQLNRRHPVSVSPLVKDLKDIHGILIDYDVWCEENKQPLNKNVIAEFRSRLQEVNKQFKKGL